MAKVVGLAASTVQAIWKAHGLSPHRWRSFKLSNDPPFAEKLTEIVGRPAQCNLCPRMLRGPRAQPHANMRSGLQDVRDTTRARDIGPIARNRNGTPTLGGVRHGSARTGLGEVCMKKAAITLFCFFCAVRV
jgi:hypothetical protein